MHLSRFLLVVALLAGLGGPVRAQSGGVPEAAADRGEAGRSAEARPLLWVVQDADSRVYLLGSFHALPPGTDVLPGPAADAFADAEAVAFEVDMAEIGSEADAMLLSLMLSFDSTEVHVPLAERLGPEDMARLEQAIGPTEPFDRFDPWVMTLLLSPMQMASAGLDPAFGVEMQVSEQVAEQGKAHLALETVGQQLEVMSGLPVEDQTTLLRSILDGIEGEGPEMMLRLVEAWRAGDAETIAALASEGETPVLHQRLLVDRNAAWTPQIEAYLDRTAPDGSPEDVLVVVGAAHLVGPDSVVEMLRVRGREVTRL